MLTKNEQFVNLPKSTKICGTWQVFDFLNWVGDTHLSSSPQKTWECLQYLDSCSGANQIELHPCYKASAMKNIRLKCLNHLPYVHLSKCFTTMVVCNIVLEEKYFCFEPKQVVHLVATVEEASDLVALNLYCRDHLRLSVWFC